MIPFVKLGQRQKVVLELMQKYLIKLREQTKKIYISFGVDTFKLIHIMKNNQNCACTMLTQKKSRNYDLQIPGITRFVFNSNQKKNHKAYAQQMLG